MTLWLHWTLTLLSDLTLNSWTQTSHHLFSQHCSWILPNFPNCSSSPSPPLSGSLFHASHIQYFPSPSLQLDPYFFTLREKSKKKKNSFIMENLQPPCIYTVILSPPPIGTHGPDPMGRMSLIPSLGLTSFHMLAVSQLIFLCFTSTNLDCLQYSLQFINEFS